MFLIDMCFRSPDAITPELRASHRAHLAPEYTKGNLIVGGRKSERTGGFILSRHASREDVKHLIDRDPLVLAGLATVTIAEFEPVMAADAHSDLLKSPD